MTKNIIFDLGGVIINIDYDRTIQEFKKLGLSSFEDLYTQANQTDLFDNIETGKISSMHFINRLLDVLPSGTKANQVVHAWNAMILDYPKERLDALLKLKEKHNIFLLSNTNSIHLEKANRMLAQVTPNGLDHYFHKVYLSHEIGFRKPHPEAFQLILDENNLDPSETTFLDDSIQHIEGAKKLGLNTIHVQKETLNYFDFS